MPSKEVLEDRFNTIKNIVNDSGAMTLSDLKRVIDAMAKNDEEEKNNKKGE